MILESLQEAGQLILQQEFCLLCLVNWWYWGRKGGRKPTHFLPSFPLSFCERRAVDNQVYVATVSPARDEKASYVAWGHSTVVNPWWVQERNNKKLLNVLFESHFSPTFPITLKKQSHPFLFVFQPTSFKLKLVLRIPVGSTVASLAVLSTSWAAALFTLLYVLCMGLSV